MLQQSLLLFALAIVFQKGIKVTFEHFGWISPDENPDNKQTYANFVYAGSQLIVRDQGSLNGVYVRISGTSELVNGSMVQA